MTKIKALENLVNPGNYKFDYSSKNNANKPENYNNIPTGKSRPNSSNSLKDSNNSNNNNNFDDLNAKAHKNDNKFSNNKNNYNKEIGYQLLCTIIKHYFCAKDAILNYTSEDLRNNISINVRNIFSFLKLLVFIYIKFKLT